MSGEEGKLRQFECFICDMSVDHECVHHGISHVIWRCKMCFGKLLYSTKRYNERIEELRRRSSKVHQ